jgi:hypothetical protein
MYISYMRWWCGMPAMTAAVLPILHTPDEAQQHNIELLLILGYPVR